MMTSVREPAVERAEHTEMKERERRVRNFIVCDQTVEVICCFAIAGMACRDAKAGSLYFCCIYQDWVSVI